MKNRLDQNPPRLPFLKAHGILRAYQAMGYDGIGVSSTDLSLGRSFFLSETAQQSPLLSANIHTPRGKLFFPPSIILKKAGVRVALIGLTDERENLPKDFTVSSWQEALDHEIHNLEDQYDFLIVLSSLSAADNQSLAAAFPQVSAIVSSYKGSMNRTPQEINNCIITSVKGRGEFLGQLTVHYMGKSGWTTVIKPSSHQLKTQLMSAQKRLMQLQDNTSSRKPRIIDQKIKRIQSYIRSLEQRYTITLEKERDSKGNSYISSFFAVHPRRDEGEVDLIVTQLKKSINGLFKKQGMNPANQKTPGAALLEIEKYAGSNSCQSCHPGPFAIWDESAHSKAYSRLVAKGQEYNPDCLACHVVPGQITDQSKDSVKLNLLQLPENRLAVGCEVCHGPAADHASSPDSIHPVRKPTVATCKKCHNEERDANFSFADKNQIIRCTKAISGHPVN